MSLKEKITEDMKAAMRARETARLATIRLMTAAIKQKEVDERIELNDDHVLAAAIEADLLVVAWGAGVTMLRGLAADRVARVTEILRGRERLGGDGREVWCWGTSKHGHPRHPLMLAYSTELELFT